MKFHSSVHPVSFSRPARAFSLLLIAAGLVSFSPAVRAEDVDIGVRSNVIDKELQWAHKTASPEEGGHSKTFAILAVDEVKSEQRLVKPVDQQELFRLLFLQLEKNGFHKYAKGTKPDILLTLSYGRGEMKNPYLRNVDTGSLLPTISGGPVAVITGAFATQLIDEKSPGFEANLQKAGFEKLFLRVTAWEYPKDPKTKPRMLWKTIIVADDPDHRDLNAIAAQMLEAGAPYFDKDLKDDKREINLYKPMPDGHVNVGTPEVVKSDVKK